MAINEDLNRLVDDGDASIRLIRTHSVDPHDLHGVAVDAVPEPYVESPRTSTSPIPGDVLELSRALCRVTRPIDESTLAALVIAATTP
jgi:hypothetical protein